MAKVAEATVWIGADLTNLKKGLATARTTLNKWGSNILSFAKTAAIGFAAVGASVLAVAISSARAAGIQQDAEKQLEAVLESTGHAAGLTAEELKKMASGLQDVTRFGDETVIGAQSLLLTFTKIGKETFPDALEAVLNVSTAMGQDLKSSALIVGKALNDPVLGMTALSRSGIQFTEDQKKVVKSLVESGDAMGAQTLILKELSTQFGGSARKAAETYAGRMDQMKNKIGDVWERIGQFFIPILEQLTNKYIMPLVDHMNDWITANGGLEDATQKIGETIDEYLPTFQQLLDWVKLMIQNVRILAELWRDLKDGFGVGSKDKLQEAKDMLDGLSGSNSGGYEIGGAPGAVFGGPSAASPMSGRGPGGGLGPITSNSPISIVINAANASARDVAELVGDEVARAIRDAMFARGLRPAT